MLRDTGTGIAPEVLPRVFDAFVQSERPLDRERGGLGLGLTLVKPLVELHDGRIEAHSGGVGRGAEFVVHLPRARTGERHVTREPEKQAQRELARVLVVEDNVDAAESLMMLLELLGHRVRVVHDGASALAAARADVPDVMLVDIGLPGMDGYDVARAVREDSGLREVVLIALTGYGSDEDRERALGAGFDHHLVKPVNVDQLQGVVTQLAAPFGRARHDTVH